MPLGHAKQRPLGDATYPGRVNKLVPSPNNLVCLLSHHFHQHFEEMGFLKMLVKMVVNKTGIDWEVHIRTLRQ